MAYAVHECYSSIEKILHSIVDGEGRHWYKFISDDRRIFQVTNITDIKIDNDFIFAILSRNLTSRVN